MLVTGGEGKEIHVIDIEKEKCLQSVKGHNSRYFYGLMFKHFSVKELGLTYLWQQQDSDLTTKSYFSKKKALKTHKVLQLKWYMYCCMWLNSTNHSLSTFSKVNADWSN